MAATGPGPSRVGRAESSSDAEGRDDRSDQDPAHETSSALTPDSRTLARSVAIAHATAPPLLCSRPGAAEDRRATSEGWGQQRSLLGRLEFDAQ